MAGEEHLNNKIKRFSFGEANFNARGGKRTERNQLVLAFVGKLSSKNPRMAITITLHKKLLARAGWMVGDCIDLSYDPNTKEAVLFPDVKGKPIVMTSQSEVARVRLKYPLPHTHPIWLENQPLAEGTEVECRDGKVAFILPF